MNLNTKKYFANLISDGKMCVSNELLCVYSTKEREQLNLTKEIPETTLLNECELLGKYDE